MHVFYDQLAEYWPLISPVEEYREEAHEFLRVLQAAHPGARTLLELGSGGGSNAFYLKPHYALTLSDLSPQMLAVSARLNPDCEHVLGDMRTMDLGRTFDLVFVHDAVDYMTTEAELQAAIATAFRHCTPGGLALFVPDHVEGRFEPDSDCGGHDGDDGRGIRYLEWSYDPDPHDNRGTTEYAFLVRDAAGQVRSLHETHPFGMFPRETWLRLLTTCGFQTEVQQEQTEEERTPRLLFVARRPA